MNFLFNKQLFYDTPITFAILAVATPLTFAILPDDTPITAFPYDAAKSKDTKGTNPEAPVLKLA